MIRKPTKRLHTSAKCKQALYQSDAAANFKKRFWPADPFDGVLISAEFLEVSDLVAVMKAARILEDEGNAAFVQNLVQYRGEHQTPMVRVNPLQTLRDIEKYFL